jgi:SAM-dependent methyltransferase
MKIQIKEFSTKSLYYKIYRFFQKFITSAYVVNDVFEKYKAYYESPEKKVLNIGCGLKKRKPHFINLDLYPYAGVDIVADAQEMPLESNSLDCVILENVFEHTKSPKKIIKEIHRVLKIKGVVITTQPFIHFYHAYPNDYWRFTEEGLKELFGNFNCLDIDTYMGPTTAIISNVAEYLTLFSFCNNKIINDIIRGCVLLLLFPFKYLDKILCKNKRNKTLACDIYGVFEKI